MTVQRTRELLGSKVAHLSDEQLLEFISRTDKVIDILFSLASKKTIVNKKELCVV